MKVHDTHSITVSKPEGLDQKIRNIFVNYLQLMVDAARDQNLWDELFSSNERRIYYLNEKVGMTIPDDVTVVFDTESFHVPQLYIKDKDGIIWISEGSEPFKVIEKLHNGEEVTQMMEITEPTKINMTIHEKFKERNIVLNMTFFDPSRDTTLFSLKYDDKEIVLTTCIL